MTGFDITIAVILMVSVVIGIYRGFARELCSLLTLILALAIAIKISRLPQTWLPDIEIMGFLLSGDDLQRWMVFLLLFFSVLIVGRFIYGKLISGAVRHGLMNVVDRCLGAAFGLFRGCVVVISLVLLAGMTALPRNVQWGQSSLVPWFEQMARYVMCYFLPNYQSLNYGCMPL